MTKEKLNQKELEKNVQGGIEAERETRAEYMTTGIEELKPDEVIVSDNIASYKQIPLK